MCVPLAGRPRPPLSFGRCTPPPSPPPAPLAGRPATLQKAIAMVESFGVPGVVLAGGLAQRMGGGDKPLREIGGHTILARAIARLAPQCECLLLSANGDPLRFASFGLPVIADVVKQHPGPLAGILAGLDW